MSEQVLRVSRRGVRAARVKLALDRAAGRDSATGVRDWGPRDRKR